MYYRQLTVMNITALKKKFHNNIKAMSASVFIPEVLACKCVCYNCPGCLRIKNKNKRIGTIAQHPKRLCQPVSLFSFKAT